MNLAHVIYCKLGKLDHNSRTGLNYVHSVRMALINAKT